MWISACEKENPIDLSQEALKSNLLNLQGKELSLNSILDEYSGRPIVLYFWASWCKDCIIGMPELREVQKQNKDVVFLNISLDRSVAAWRNGIDRYNVIGNHYFMSSGWDGPLVDFVDLDWIPRYILLDREGKIQQFNVLKATDLELSSE